MTAFIFLIAATFIIFIILFFDYDIQDSNAATGNDTKEYNSKIQEKLVQEKPYYRDVKKLKFREKTNKYINNDDVLRDWKFINQQNISKANFICNNENYIPQNKESVAQNKIFNNELQKYVYAKDSVSILNAFPLFLLEYFKDSSFILP